MTVSGIIDAVAVDEQTTAEPSPSTENRTPHPILDGSSLIGLVEMILKAPARIDGDLRDEHEQRSMAPKLLAVALVGFTIYGVMMTIILNVAAEWTAGVPLARFDGWTALNLILAYNLGLIAANGVCLPSFYFYGLLAGVKTSMIACVAHAMKGMAAGAIALVGILPIYTALMLGAIVFDAPVMELRLATYLGLALPFLAGIWGANSLYTGFIRLSDTIDPQRCGNRECFLRRLILAWCGCYTAVTPLMIYTLWLELSGLPK